MYIDQKCTVWVRQYFDDSCEEMILKKLDEDSDSIEYILDSEGFELSDILYDTFEELHVEDNEGESTIEVYNSKGELLFENKKL